jgi:hypothetical protein
MRQRPEIQEMLRPQRRKRGLPDVLRVDAIKRAQHDLDERMLRYARLRFGADWLFDALDAYTAGTRVEMSKMEEQFAVPWAMYHWDNAPHRLSLARTFLDSDGDRLPSDQQDVLTSCLNAWLGIWEVTQIEKGRGFVAVDQLSKQERFIHEKRGTETLRMRDSILGYVHRLQWNLHRVRLSSTRTRSSRCRTDRSGNAPVVPCTNETGIHRDSE